MIYVRMLGNIVDRSSVFTHNIKYWMMGVDGRRIAVL